MRLRGFRASQSSVVLTVFLFRARVCVCVSFLGLLKINRFLHDVHEAMAMDMLSSESATWPTGATASGRFSLYASQGTLPKVRSAWFRSAWF